MSEPFENVRTSVMARLKNGEEISYAQVKQSLGLKPKDGDDKKIVYLDENGNIRSKIIEEEND